MSSFDDDLAIELQKRTRRAKSTADELQSRRQAMRSELAYLSDYLHSAAHTLMLAREPEVGLFSVEVPDLDRQRLDEAICLQHRPDRRLDEFVTRRVRSRIAAGWRLGSFFFDTTGEVWLLQPVSDVAHPVIKSARVYNDTQLMEKPDHRIGSRFRGTPGPTGPGAFVMDHLVRDQWRFFVLDSLIDQLAPSAWWREFCWYQALVVRTGGDDQAVPFKSWLTASVADIATRSLP